MGTTVTALDPISDAATMTSDPMLVVRGVSKVFRRRHTEVVALDEVDLHVDRGELVCLVGASGCGKSTLLAIVAGLDEPTSGVVLVEGDQVIGPGADRGMVFQGYSLYPWKTVSQNIAFGLEVARWPRRPASRGSRSCSASSGSPSSPTRCRRSCPAGCASASPSPARSRREPDVLLLDEPFGALDAQTKRHMQDFLLTIWRQLGATILMVTHDVDEAVYLSSRVYVMSARPGRIAEQIEIPFGRARGPHVRRDPRFLDVRDELNDLLG